MSDLHPESKVEHAYAVVRVELDMIAKAISHPEHLNLYVTVKKVVWSEVEAEAEAKRLNALNRDKGCYYFSQITRIERTQG